MPTRPTKGDHGHADRGSHERGPQKAAVGTAVDPEFARLQAEAIGEGPWKEELEEFYGEKVEEERDGD
jgi:hypothetical protein